jgi:type I restriction-modification system DNA methylase subunit
MPLSLNEVRTRAAAFARDWADAYDEDAEAKSFWDGFFRVFGQERRQVAMFEKFVTKLNNKQGYIDLFWPGKLVVEHKSKGKNLDRAFDQATDYFTGLKPAEYPRYIIVSDFARIRLYDLDHNSKHEITLAELPEKVDLFKFIAGYEQAQYKEQDHANIEAAELMGKLHDAMLATGYEGHALELYLVRLLFCLFAEDSNIFEKYQFQAYIEDRTARDGSDLGAKLSELFYVLNTEPAKRLKNLDEQLSAFAYVNGGLFQEMLPPASFDAHMREKLLECCSLDWSRISPAIFGSLFQSVMDKEKRRNLGAHYTSEKNILKLIKPLFLDELQEEFETIKAYKNSTQRHNALNKFHLKLSELRFLDPACGCGNFLIVSYRELRALELEVIRELQGIQMVTDVSQLVLCDVGQFYGIEIEEFPSQIAQVALWLMDHQMNLRVSDTFGQYYARLPLKSQPHVVHANALRTDWQSLITPMPWDKKPAVFDFILGNPPFLGKNYQTKEQKEDVASIFNDSSVAGNLDLVCAWYRKALDYMVHSPETITGLVSTNSVTQGELAYYMWSNMLPKGATIRFAHRTFQWNNEARGNAAVHCVIIGYSVKPTTEKYLFYYPDIKGDPVRSTVKNISPYLTESGNTLIPPRTSPICPVKSMVNGSKPTDGGHLLMNEAEKNELVQKEPGAEKWIRRFAMGEEFINDIKRYCLWLPEITPDELRQLPLVKKRVEAVQNMRLASKDKQTQMAAGRPTLFQAIRQPTSNYIALPRVSSENRVYIPIGFLNAEFIAGEMLQLIPNGTLWDFGVMTSINHMTWVRYICGRLKSDYRYSASIVYNNFPWPESPTDAQKQAVEEAAQLVLDTRAKYPDSSLATLYNPLTMPGDLLKAHQQLDKAVDKCYRKEPFKDNRERIAYLFGLYEKYTAGLLAGLGEKKGRKKKV